MNIKIIVAAHKEYTMPSEDIYLPVHVGSALSKADLSYQRDDDGADNISDKNPYFCELTGIYWAWKNLDADAVGLVHYRRLFGKKIDNLLTAPEAIKLLENSAAILPKKRNYYIETLYSHYAHTMHVTPLNVTGEIIKEKYPEYYPEFEKLNTRTSAHMFNMFVMRRDTFDKYCEWLFDILFELEKRVDTKDLDAFHARFYGRVSELLMDVWMNTNNVSFAEYPIVYAEKVNWLKKGSAFLAAKFFKKKYDKSF